MRKIRLGLVTFLLCTNLALAGVNTWTARGPFGGIAPAVAIDPANPSVVFAAAMYALYKSTDGGVTWSLVPQDFGSYPIRKIAFSPADPSVLYVVAMGGGVFRSTNSGSTFSRISALPVDANVDGPSGFAVSADGKTLYYSSLGNQFYRSIDGGSFSRVTDTPSVVQQLTVDPANSRVVYGADGGQLLKSINGGDSWSTLPLPSGVTSTFSVVLVPGSPVTLWLSASSNIYSTTNDGGSWIAAAPIMSARTLFPDPNAPAVLYATMPIATGTVMKYSAGSWLPLFGILPAAVNALAITPGNSQRMVAATANGIYRTTNGGSTDWTRSDSGFSGASIGTLQTSGGRFYAGTEFGELGVAVGDSFMQNKVVASTLTTSYSRTQISSVAANAGNSDAIVVGFRGAGYKYTNDGGVTWLDGSTYLKDAWIDALAADPTSASIVYAAARTNPMNVPFEVIQRSVDGGQSFSPRPSNIGKVQATRLLVDPSTPSRLFLSSVTYGSGIDGLMRSNDSGVTWTNLLPGATVWDVAIDRAKPQRIYSAAGSLLISDNRGDSFTPSASYSAATQGNAIAVAVDPANPDTVYAISAYSPDPIRSGTTWYVMRSVDRGASWERIPNKTPNWAPRSLALDPTTPNVVAVATYDSGVHTMQIATDLSVGIAGHTGTRALGVPTGYDVTAQNLGPFAATGVHIISVFPTWVANVAATLPGGSCVVAAASVDCSLPYLKVNDSVAMRVTYTPPMEGALPIAAMVSAREADLVSANNSANVSATAAETVDLAVTGSAAPSSMDRGTAFTYTYQIRNNGPNASSVADLSITAANGVAFSTVSPSSCSLTASAVSCSLGPLAGLASASVSITATATNTGTLRTVATAGHAAAAVDADGSNDSAPVDIISREPPPPSLPPTSGGNGGGGGGTISKELLAMLALLVLASARRRRAASAGRR